MKLGIWFLRIILGALAILVIAVATIPVPIMLREMFEGAPHHLVFAVVLLALGVYIATLGFISAVVFVFQFFNDISHKRTLTPPAVTRLHRLTYSLVAITGGIWLFLPLIYTIAQLNDAPGLLLIGLALALIPLILTTFMAILAHVWQGLINEM